MIPSSVSGVLGPERRPPGLRVVFHLLSSPVLHHRPQGRGQTRRKRHTEILSGTGRDPESEEWIF